MTGLSRGYKNLAVQGVVSHFVVVQGVKEPCPGGKIKFTGGFRTIQSLVQGVKKPEV